MAYHVGVVVFGGFILAAAFIIVVVVAVVVVRLDCYTVISCDTSFLVRCRSKGSCS